MKTILRNAVTGLYYQGVADWTERLGEAFDFQRPERLVRFVRAAGLKPEEMELIFAFEDPRYNLVLAIDERFGVRRASSRKRRTSRPYLLPEFPGQSEAIPTNRHGSPATRQALPLVM